MMTEETNVGGYAILVSKSLRGRAYRASWDSIKFVIAA